MLRILVVDDIYTNRYLLAELIKLTGNEAVLAEDGQQARDILKNEKECWIYYLSDIYFYKSKLSSVRACLTGWAGQSRTGITYSSLRV